MNGDHLRTVVAYNAWANGRLLEACRDLTPEELARDLGTSWVSVHGTLFHIVHGEWKWLRFWRGQSYDDPFPPEQYPSVATLKAKLEEIAADQLSFVAGLNDESLNERSIVRGREFSLAQMLHHSMNHSSYHRGQVATLLRQLARVPPSVDFMRFLEQVP